MKNELNLFVMSVDDAIRWYKPQTEEESYLVDLLTQTSSKTAKELQDEVADLQTQNEILENENTQLKMLNDRLEKRVSNLENKILEKLDHN